MTRAATSADVAERAGVSRATVSYVLNQRADQTISPATIAAVHKAAADLGYRPNPFAQSLKRGRGGTVLLPLAGVPLASVLADGIDACAAALAGLGLTLITDTTGYASAADRADAWLRLHPAAVIDLFLPPGDAAIGVLRQAGIVVLTAGTGDSAAHAFALAAREQQVAYVLERGHRRVMQAGPGADDRAVERRWRTSVNRAIARVGGEFTMTRAPITAAGVQSVVRTCAASMPDAICAYNDEFAIALITAFTAAGVRVPDDVAVIGVDNIALGAAITPTLTTVAPDFREWGDAIASRVKAALDGPPSADAMPTLHSQVIRRQSA